MLSESWACRPKGDDSPARFEPKFDVAERRPRIERNQLVPGAPRRVRRLRTWSPNAEMMRRMFLLHVVDDVAADGRIPQRSVRGT